MAINLALLGDVQASSVERILVEVIDFPQRRLIRHSFPVDVLVYEAFNFFLLL
jgi:hypothetical protein